MRFWGERLNFDITVAEIQPKVWERIRKRWREKMLNFGNGDIEFPVPNSIAWVCVEWPKWREKKNWQTNCGNAIAEIGEKNCNNCDNDITENVEKKCGCWNLGRNLKKSVTFTIFSQ